MTLVNETTLCIHAKKYLYRLAVALCIVRRASVVCMTNITAYTMLASKGSRLPHFELSALEKSKSMSLKYRPL